MSKQINCTNDVTNFSGELIFFKCYFVFILLFHLILKIHFSKCFNICGFNNISRDSSQIKIQNSKLIHSVP